MLSKRTMAPLAAAAALFSANALAQSAGDFPNHPVTVMLPYSPNGSSDIEARLYQPELINAIGVPVVIEYKPGAGASLGTRYVRDAKPDGYTVLGMTPTFALYPACFRMTTCPTIRSRNSPRLSR